MINTLPALEQIIRIPITFQQLEGDGYHIFTEIRVGNDPMFMLVDTGASKTVFSEKIIDKYPELEIMDLNENMAAGIGEEKMAAKLVTFPVIYLGEASITRLQCGIINFSHVDSAYNAMGLKTFDGIIGGDILKHFGAEINYQQAYIALHLPDEQ